MTLTQLFTSIANAIRTKKGTEALIQAEDFADEISTIETGIDTSDATAEPINIRDGETAYVDGQKITGILPVLTYPTNPQDPSDYNYQFIASTSTSKVTREGADYLLGSYQIASQSQSDSWMFEGNRKMKMGVPVSRVVSIGGITASKIKKGETIYGVTGTYEGSGSINIFVQTTQPSGYNGIWINSSNTYNNIVEVSSISNIVASSINIIKGTTYETILFESSVQNGVHYKFSNVIITDQSNNIVSGNSIYYGNGSQWIDIRPYIELQYIQATGTQYINTGITANNNVDIEVNFRCNATSPNYMRVWGIQSSSSFEMLMVSTENTHWKFNNGSTARTIDARSTYKTVKLLGSTGLLYVDGSLLATENTSGNTGKTLWIFRGNDRYSNVYMTYCKIWNSGTLVRYLIPVKRKSDNAIGMYDMANSVFYSNAGTGTFVAGPEKN